ncbi:MAG: TRAP transporter large permease subunit, partial [Burkholderiales bacterium]
MRAFFPVRESRACEAKLNVAQLGRIRGRQIGINWHEAICTAAAGAVQAAQNRTQPHLCRARPCDAGGGGEQRLLGSARQASSIFAIAIGAKVFVAFIAYTQVAVLFASWVAELGLSPLMLMLILTILYIILGMFMDPLGIMLLTLPV